MIGRIEPFEISQFKLHHTSSNLLRVHELEQIRDPIPYFDGLGIIDNDKS